MRPAPLYIASTALSGLFFLLRPAFVFCQPPPDTTTASASVPALHLSFERIANTFLWNMSGQYNTASGPWRVTVQERFLRSLIKTDREQIRDEQTFRSDLEAVLAPTLSAAASFRSYIFADNRSLALNALNSNKVLAGLKWSPAPNLAISPMAGYAFDNQQGSLDQGPMYAVDASLRDLRIGDTRVSGEALAASEHINPRMLQEQRVTGELSTVFGRSAANRALLSFRRNRRDFYLPVAGVADARDIESRTETLFAVTDNLEYEMLRNLTFSAKVDALQRRIIKRRRETLPSPDRPVFDGAIDEFRLTGSAELRFRNSGGSAAGLRMEVGERNENHSIERNAQISDIVFSRQQRLEEQKNNSILQSHLSAHATLPLGERDTISAAVSTVKLVYNTPSASNNDDRDELLYLAAMRWTRRLNPWLVASMTGDAQLRHTVFIYGERSANNTWNRVFRISPSVLFHPGRVFSSVNRAEVVANYTVYDFESVSSPQPSFSLRQISFADSSTVRLSRSVHIELRTFLRFFEQGEIRWSAFTLRPLFFNDERTFAIEWHLRRRNFSCAAGFRLFRQSRYRYEHGDKKPDVALSSYGPVCRVELQVGRAASVIADGWYQITELSGASGKTTPNLSLRLLWNL